MCVLVLGPNAPAPRLWRGEEQSESGDHRSLSMILSDGDGLCASKGLTAERRKKVINTFLRIHLIEDVCPKCNLNIPGMSRLRFGYGLFVFPVINYARKHKSTMAIMCHG